MIKTKIKIILNFIKRLLTFFIKNTIPEPRPIKYPRPTAFEIFEKEQQIACYNEIKKHKKGAEKLLTAYEKLVMRSLFGNTNASRNSA